MLCPYRAVNVVPLMVNVSVSCERCLCDRRVTISEPSFREVMWRGLTHHLYAEAYFNVITARRVRHVRVENYQHMQGAAAHDQHLSVTHGVRWKRDVSVTDL